MPNLVPITDVDDNSNAPVAPAGPLSIAIDALHILIANVPYFQTFTGTADAAHALLRVFTGDTGYPIQAIEISSNILTLTTREPHGIVTGQVINIEGASLGAESEVDIDGPQTVLSVSQTTISIAFTAPDLAEVYPELAFVMPCVRPIAVIAPSDDALRSRSIGTGGAAIYAGGIDILIEADTSVVHQHNALNAELEARNAVGLLLEGIMETQDTADFMVLNACDIVQGPEFTKKTEQDDNYPRFERWRALLRVAWGLEG